MQTERSRPQYLYHAVMKNKRTSSVMQLFPEYLKAKLSALLNGKVWRHRVEGSVCHISALLIALICGDGAALRSLVPWNWRSLLTTIKPRKVASTPVPEQ